MECFGLASITLAGKWLALLWHVDCSCLAELVSNVSGSICGGGHISPLEAVIALVLPRLHQSSSIQAVSVVHPRPHEQVTPSSGALARELYILRPLLLLYLALPNYSSLLIRLIHSLSLPPNNAVVIDI